MVWVVPERSFARHRVRVMPGFSAFVHHIGTGGHPYDVIGPPMCGLTASADWAERRPARPTAARVAETRTKRNA